MTTSDNPNLAKTQDVNGKTVETNKPSAPTGVNSSNAYQSAGSSIAKPAQGILANTMTSINNVIPAAGCPIKLPNLMEKLQSDLKLWIQTEENRVNEWVGKLSDFVDPLVEEIKHAISAVNQMIKEIQYYINQIKKVIQEIQQFMQELTAFLNFLLTLPGRLINLIQNCVSQLVGGSGGLVSTATTALNNAASNTTPPTNTTQPVSS